MDDELPQLPALKALSRLSELRPTIVVDSREQLPLPFARLKTVTAGLRAGDYSVVGLEEIFAVERKSVSDLVGCCVDSSRERFAWELHRLRGYMFKRLLVVGDRADIVNGNYRSNLAPKAVLATLSAFEMRYQIPVVFSPTPEEAGALVEGWAYWASREIVEMANVLCRDNGLTRPAPA